MIKLEDLYSCPSVLSKSTVAFSDDINITTDSRALDSKNCFIALYGPNFNANKFIENVINNVRVVVYCKPDNELIELTKITSDKIFIEVEDTFKFLLELGEVVSRKWQSLGGVTIGVTGSNGKTTNKEIIFGLLEKAYPNAIHKTQGNLNNNIGVPLTIFDLKTSHKFSIVEMGMNHVGEIYPLVKCANPSCGLITSIGTAHLEFMKSVDNIFKEKKVLYDWVEQNKTNEKLFVVNRFDKYLEKLPREEWIKSISKDNFKMCPGGFILTYDDKEYAIRNRFLFGDHNKYNLAQCLLLVLEILKLNNFKDIEKITTAAEQFQMPSMNRGDFKIVNGIHIYLDAYNANPESMLASLGAFNELCENQKISKDDCLYILGDMNELGESSQAIHQKLGSDLKNIGAKHSIFVGRFSKNYVDGFGSADTYESSTELKSNLINYKGKFKAVFLKGSRSLQLESIIDINDSF